MPKFKELKKLMQQKGLARQIEQMAEKNDSPMLKNLQNKLFLTPSDEQAAKMLNKEIPVDTFADSFHNEANDIGQSAITRMMIDFKKQEEYERAIRQARKITNPETSKSSLVESANKYPDPNIVINDPNIDEIREAFIGQKRKELHKEGNIPELYPTERESSFIEPDGNVVEDYIDDEPHVVQNRWPVIRALLEKNKSSK